MHNMSRLSALYNIELLACGCGVLVKAKWISGHHWQARHKFGSRNKVAGHAKRSLQEAQDNSGSDRGGFGSFGSAYAIAGKSVTSKCVALSKPTLTTCDA
jgi:hypothetical protein